MGKLKELFEDAQERRRYETNCTTEDAASWVGDQSVQFLLNYVEEWLNEKDKHWPQKGDTYYFISGNGCIYEDAYDPKYMPDARRRALGNFFKTEKDANFEAGKLKIISELRSLANDDQPWDDKHHHYSLTYDHKDNVIIIESRRISQNMGSIYFKSIDDVRQAINRIGEDRIKKYLFGVE